jgi:23S rRNA (uracil1939-C5)-methyltransferase
VVAEVEDLRRSYWRGRAVDVISASPDRTLAPGDVCPGCDWGHFDPDAARAAKRDLFLETMQRIGKLPPGTFGSLPIAPSPLAYRIRNRFHVAGRGEDLAIGQFEPRSHRFQPFARCAALTPAMSELLPALRDVLGATAAEVRELATLEDFDGEKRLARALLADGTRRQIRSEADEVVRALAPLFVGVKVGVLGETTLLRETGESRLPISVGRRTFLVSVESFFQGNRHLADRLLADVARASAAPPSEALDAFGGVGFFAASLLDAGHAVVSVEGNPSAARDAAKTRLGWSDADRWKIVPSSVAGFLSSSTRRYGIVVADPPRAGLGRIARPLAELARNRFVYVSCEPPTLARDLPEILGAGFDVVDARLYDLFPLTHRVEAVVTLARRTSGAA